MKHLLLKLLCISGLLSFMNLNAQTVDWKFSFDSDSARWVNTLFSGTDSNQYLFPYNFTNQGSFDLFGTSTPGIPFSGQKAGLAKVSQTGSLEWNLVVRNSTGPNVGLSRAFSYKDEYYLLLSGYGVFHTYLDGILLDTIVCDFGLGTCYTVCKISPSGELQWYQCLWQSSNSSVQFPALSALAWNFRASSSLDRVSLFFAHNDSVLIGKNPANVVYADFIDTTVCTNIGVISKEVFFTTQGQLDTVLTYPGGLFNNVNRFTQEPEFIQRSATQCAAQFAGFNLPPNFIVETQLDSNFNTEFLFGRQVGNLQKSLISMGKNFSYAIHINSSFAQGIPKDTVFTYRDNSFTTIDSGDVAVFDDEFKFVRKKRTFEYNPDSMFLVFSGGAVQGKYLYLYGFISHTRNANDSIRIGDLFYPIPGRTISSYLLKIDERLNVLWFQYIPTGFSAPRASVTELYIDRAGDLLFQLVNFPNNQAIFFNDTFPSQAYRYESVIKIKDQTIRRGEVFAGPYCAGDSIRVPFEVTGVYDTSNVFIAQMSDENGEFADQGSIIELGRIKGNTGDTIVGSLPGFQVNTSANYRIRIISTEPQVQSFFRLDTLQLLIFSKDTADLGEDTLLCQGVGLELSTFGGSEWDWYTDSTFDSTSRFRAWVKPVSDRYYKVTISDSSGCGVVDSDSIFVQLRDPLELTGDTTYQFCQGEQIQLITQIDGGDSTAYSLEYELLESGGWLTVNLPDSLADTTFEARIILKDQCTVEPDTLYINAQVDTIFPVQLTASDTVLCQAEATQLSISAQGCKGPYLFDWIGFNNSTDSLRIIPDSSMWVKVLTSDSNSSLSRLDSIFIRVLPPLSASGYTDTSVCYKNALSFNVQPAGGNANYQIEWRDGSSTAALISNSTGWSDTMRFSRRIWLQVQDACSPPFTDSFQIDVSIKPTAEILSDTVFCFGEEAEFTTNTSGVLPFQYQWSSQSSTGTDSSFILPVEQNGTTNLIVNDACSDTTIVLSRNFQVLPPLSITTTKDTTVCIGQELELNPQLSGGTGTYQINWSGGYQSIRTVSSTQVFLSANNSYTAQAILQDNCSLQDTARINVFYFSRPELMASATDSVCVLKDIKVTLSASQGVPPYQFFWNSNSFSGDTSFALSNPGANKFRVAVSDACQVEHDTLIGIEVMPNPDLTFQLSDTQVCAGTPVDFIYRGQAPTWTWEVGGEKYPGDATVSYDQAGTYSFRLIAESGFGCGDSTDATDILEVYPNPVAEFQILPTEPREGDTLRIINLSQGSTAWLWNLDGIQSINRTPDPIFADSSRILSVSLLVRSDQNCTDTTSRFLFIREYVWIAIPSAFTPNDDGLNDDWGAEFGGMEDLRIQVFNRWGQLIWESQTAGDRWTGAGIPSGSYLYIVRGRDIDSQLVNKKGIVELIR